jgi:hypothetical protein
MSKKMTKPKRKPADKKVGPPAVLFGRVVSILEQARGNVVRAVNSQMVLAYWLIGREIVQELQGGEGRAAYGEKVLKDLSVRLNDRYGKGFSEQSLQNFRRFYLAYSERFEISSPMGRKLETEQKLHPAGGESSEMSIVSPMGAQSADSAILSPLGRFFTDFSG